MKEIIKAKLHEIEDQQEIKILFACESGSRAWGFPSPDSDYDVRFIYIRPRNYYLSIHEKLDFINYPESQNLDIEGWDIVKALRLMGKSNTTIFEWLQSPIVYYQVDNFQETFWSLSLNFFCMKSNMHHYLGIAKGAFATITDLNIIKIKKLFYVLRPLLAAKWCYEKKSIAPMSILPLLNLMPDNFMHQVINLITIKESSPEGFLIEIDSALLAYVKNELDTASQNVQDVSKQTLDKQSLDPFFRNILLHYDH